jgi:hypothetical protein
MTPTTHYCTIKQHIVIVQINSTIVVSLIVLFELDCLKVYFEEPLVDRLSL